MTRDSSLVVFGVSVYTWLAALVVELMLLTGCLSAPDVPFPDQEPCVTYEAAMAPAGTTTTYSMSPAPLGVRIIVDDTFYPFMGASTPVPGGRMAWSVWVYHWDDGNHLGAIGRLIDDDFEDVPRGGMCRWYDPL